MRQTIKQRADVPGTRAIILDAEAIAFIDVTAAQMLGELAGDLKRVDVQFVIAHDLGQVGDILAAEQPEIELQVYPSVNAAIAAIGPAPPGDST